MRPSEMPSTRFRLNALPIQQSPGFHQCPILAEGRPQQLSLLSVGQTVRWSPAKRSRWTLPFFPKAVPPPPPAVPYPPKNIPQECPQHAQPQSRRLSLWLNPIQPPASTADGQRRHREAAHHPQTEIRLLLLLFLSSFLLFFSLSFWRTTGFTSFTIQRCVWVCGRLCGSSSS